MVFILYLILPHKIKNTLIIMKRKCYKIFLLTVMFCAAQYGKVNAQTGMPCGTDQQWWKQVAEHPELLQMKMTYDADLVQKIKTMHLSSHLNKSGEPVLVIPVVVHVLHVFGSENISDRQIYDMIKLVNRDWAMLNPDITNVCANTPFDTLAAPMNLEFRLAQLDPNGRCTNGIDRIYTHKTFEADDGSKLNQWPRDKYLNIWTVNTLGPPTSTAAAYALYPTATLFYPQGDGVISTSSYVGYNGTSTALNSRTITHEIGHCFDLEHVWGNTNNPWVACGDDGVDDTPRTRGHYMRCNDSAYCTTSWAKKIVYNFNGLHLPQGTTDPSVGSSNTPTLSGPFSAHGAGTNPSDHGRFSFNNWGIGATNGVVNYSSLTGALDSSKYYEVTIATDASHSMTINGFDFDVNRSVTGIRTFAVRSSINGFASNIGTASLSPFDTTKIVVKPNNVFFYKKDTTVNVSGSHITLGTGYSMGFSSSITFRFYGWNAEDALGTFGIDNVNFYISTPTVDTINYTFDNMFPPTVGSNFDVTPVQVDTAVTVGTFSANNVGYGVGSLESLRFSYDNWGLGGVGASHDTTYSNMTGAWNPSKFYEVTLGPQYANSMTLNSLTFNVKRNSTGIRSFAVRSSQDGYATNLPATISPANTNLRIIGGANEFFYLKDTTLDLVGAKITLGGTNYINRLTPVTFRFYAWNAEDSTGTFSIDNVNFADYAGIIENYQNYMDYSYCGPNGQIMFTRGQKDRARAAATSAMAYRNNLYINSNLHFTGVDTTYHCIPKPDFYSDKKEICAGGSITFRTNITCISDSTSYTKTWRFPGANTTGVGPTTVNAANSATQTNSQTVTYSNPGDYPVTLIVSNSVGTDSLVKTSYIHVSPGWPQYNGTVTETFENGSYWNWVINNYDNNAHGWSLYNSGGYSGNHCMAMGGYGNYHKDLDDFITPGFNLFGLTNGVFTFRCAAASHALASIDLNDELKVYSSTDCGATWVLRKSLSGAALCNNGYYAGGFAPASQSQWALVSFNIASNLAKGNVRFKFEYTTGSASNNVFIDDININGTVGMIENSIDDANVSLFPNPSSESTTIFYHLNSKGNVKIELFDVVGKKVVEINNNNQADGDYSTIISKQDYNLTNGIYFVKFSIDGKMVTKKLILFL